MTARRNRAVCVAVLAVGLPLTVHAQNLTLLRLQASLDGRTWSETVRVPESGGRVLLRAAVSFVSTTSAAPLGFAGLTWQPTLSNWRDASDTLLTWSDRGNNTTGGSVPDVPGINGPFGRIVPFAASGPSSSDPYRGHVQTIDGTRYLRLARSSISNWIGEGATTGTNAFNNFNGSGGLFTWQKSWGNVSSRDPRFAPESSDRVILKLGIDLRPGHGRTLVFDAPLDGMSRNSATGAREASWFADQTDNFGQIKGGVVVRPATIIVVPAAGTVPTLGLLGLLVRRRRR